MYRLADAARIRIRVLDEGKAVTGKRNVDFEGSEGCPFLAQFYETSVPISYSSSGHISCPSGHTTVKPSVETRLKYS